MKTYAKLFNSILILFLITLAGCTKSPTVTDIWMDEAFDGKKYEKILVIGAAEKITARSLLEAEVVNQLKSQGTEAIRSYIILPDNAMLTREIILSAVEKSDIDSVLITVLADRSKKTVYYQAGGSPYGYYNSIYPSIHSSRGTTASYDIEILFLKTNLYDVKSEKLIWSMTYEFEFLHKAKSLNSAVNLVINKLREDGLI